MENRDGEKREGKKKKRLKGGKNNYSVKGRRFAPFSNFLEWKSSER